MMGFMSSMTYYQTTFSTEIGFNVGLLCSSVLIALLIFLELARAQLQEKTIATLARLRLRFNTVTWILFTIFMGIVYTQVLMLIY